MLHHLGIEPFQRQKHHRKVRGVGRSDVLADAARLGAHGGHQGLARGIHRRLIAILGSLGQTGVILLRELAVDGQIDRRAALLAAGEAHSELHPLVGAGRNGHVALVLRIGQGLLQQGAQLNLAPYAAGFDVAQHALEVAHAAGQAVDLAQRAVDLLQTLAYLRKAGGEAFFQRGAQLFIHGLAHFVQLLRVFLPHQPRAFRHRGAKRFHARFVLGHRARQRGLRALHARLDALEALVGDALHALLAQVERLRVIVALPDERVDLLRLGAAHRAKRAGEILTQLADRTQKLLAPLIALLAERAFSCLQFAPKPLLQGGERCARSAPPPKHDGQQHRQQNDAQKRKRQADRGGRS